MVEADEFSRFGLQSQQFNVVNEDYSTCDEREGQGYPSDREICFTRNRRKYGKYESDTYLRTPVCVSGLKKKQKALVPGKATMHEVEKYAKISTDNPLLPLLLSSDTRWNVRSPCDRY